MGSFNSFPQTSQHTVYKPYLTTAASDYQFNTCAQSIRHTKSTRVTVLKQRFFEEPIHSKAFCPSPRFEAPPALPRTISSCLIAQHTTTRLMLATRFTYDS